MTLEQWEEEQDRELEERLTALFKSAEPPAPLPGFVMRTMKAVRQAPLAEGRQPLRRPWMVPVGWAALVAGAAYAVAANQRLVAEVLSAVIGLGVRAVSRLAQSVHTSSLVFELLATISRAISRAMSTPEAAAGLLVMALVAALSLSMLNKLLGSEKESSAW